MRVKAEEKVEEEVEEEVEEKKKIVFTQEGAEIELINGRIVKMRRPKVKDNRAVAHIEDDSEREITLFASLTGLRESEINEIYLSDYMKLQQAYTGLAIGEQSIEIF